MQLTPAVRMGASISIAVGLYGISFGALATASGLTVLQTVALSALMFTGGSQFAFIGAMAGGGAAATSSAVLLGVRNLIYGAELNAQFHPRGWMRPLMAQFTIDESFATAMAQDDPAEQRRGFWTGGVGVWLTWNAMTIVGALIGTALGDARTWGLDGAAAAAFLGLLWPRLKSRDAVAIAVASAFVTIVAVPVLPQGIPLLVAAAVAALAGVLRRRTAASEEELVEAGRER